MFGKKKEKIFFFENNKKESVQLEHENVTELVLVTLQNGIEERGEILEPNQETNPMTSKKN